MAKVEFELSDSSNAPVKHMLVGQIISCFDRLLQNS